MLRVADLLERCGNPVADNIIFRGALPKIRRAGFWTDPEVKPAEKLRKLSINLRLKINASESNYWCPDQGLMKTGGQTERGRGACWQKKAWSSSANGYAVSFKTINLFGHCKNGSGKTLALWPWLKMITTRRSETVGMEISEQVGLVKADTVIQSQCPRQCYLIQTGIRCNNRDAILLDWTNVTLSTLFRRQQVFFRSPSPLRKRKQLLTLLHTKWRLAQAVLLIMILTARRLHDCFMELRNRFDHPEKRTTKRFIKAVYI